MSAVLLANVFAMVAFVFAFAELHRHRAEHTLNGRAAQAMLAALILLSLVGFTRRIGWEYAGDAQAVAWIVAGSAALVVVFMGPDHDRDYPIEGKE